MSAFSPKCLRSFAQTSEVFKTSEVWYGDKVCTPCYAMESPA